MNDPPTNRELYELFLSLDNNTKGILDKVANLLEMNINRIQVLEDTLINLHKQILLVQQELGFQTALVRNLKKK